MPDQALAVIPHPMGGIPAERVRAKIQTAFQEIEPMLTEWQPAPAHVAAQRVPRFVKLTGSVSDVITEFRSRGWAAERGL